MLKEAFERVQKQKFELNRLKSIRLPWWHFWNRYMLYLEIEYAKITLTELELEYCEIENTERGK